MGRGGEGIELASNISDIQLARFSMSTLGLVLIGPEKPKKKLFILRNVRSNTNVMKGVENLETDHC